MIPSCNEPITHFDNKLKMTHLASMFFAGLLFSAHLGASEVPDVAGDAPLFHARMIWKDDPTTTATISWSTSFGGKTHLVRLRKRRVNTVGDAGEFTEVACHHNGRFGRSPRDKPTYFHHALLENLTPATAYDVSLVSDGRTSRQFSFVTAPQADRAFSLLFGGDSRGNQAKRQLMNKMIAKLCSQGAQSDDPADEILAFAHVGDYVKTGVSFEDWFRWLTDHELTTTTDGRLLPLIPARGNHDRGLLYGEVFDFEPTDGNYFVSDLGSLAALITLNTEASIAGEQAVWLRRQLDSYRPKHRWLLAQYHRPAYPAVRFPSGVLAHWVPMFDEFNLDLACEGDGHVIKRTVPIRNNRRDETGVVYIGEGGLAVGQRQPKLDRWFLQPPGMADRGHHLQRITFRPDSLTYECLLANGKVVDTWQRR